MDGHTSAPWPGPQKVVPSSMVKIESSFDTQVWRIATRDVCTRNPSCRSVGSMARS